MPFFKARGKAVPYFAVVYAVVCVLITKFVMLPTAAVINEQIFFTRINSIKSVIISLAVYKNVFRRSYKPASQ